MLCLPAHTGLCNFMCTHHSCVQVKNTTVHGLFWGSYLQHDPKVSHALCPDRSATVVQHPCCSTSHHTRLHFHKSLNWTDNAAQYLTGWRVSSHIMALGFSAYQTPGSRTHSILTWMECICLDTAAVKYCSMVHANDRLKSTCMVALSTIPCPVCRCECNVPLLHDLLSICMYVCMCTGPSFFHVRHHGLVAIRSATSTCVT